MMRITRLGERNASRLDEKGAKHEGMEVPRQEIEMRLKQLHRPTLLPAVVARAIPARDEAAPRRADGINFEESQAMLGLASNAIGYDLGAAPQPGERAAGQPDEP
jgi:hypothetical protein